MVKVGRSATCGLAQSLQGQWLNPWTTFNIQSIIMKTSDIKLGLRVRVLSNGLIAVVVGTPEYYTGNASLTRIKYENSTRYEYMINKQLQPLPMDQQYEGVGGKLKVEDNQNG